MKRDKKAIDQAKVQARMFLGEFRAALGNEGRMAGSRTLLCGELAKLGVFAAESGEMERSVAYSLIADCLIWLRLKVYKLASLDAVEACLKLAAIPNFGVEDLDRIYKTLDVAGFETTPQARVEANDAAE